VKTVYDDLSVPSCYLPGLPAMLETVHLMSIQPSITDGDQKLLCERDPLAGADLASQPTLSRFENAVDRADLTRTSLRFDRRDHAPDDGKNGDKRHDASG
jgi:hypothetical protein